MNGKVIDISSKIYVCQSLTTETKNVSSEYIAIFDDNNYPKFRDMDELHKCVRGTVSVSFVKETMLRKYAMSLNIKL